MSEKYTYYEVGECDTWHIWDDEVRVLKDDSFFALCNTVEEAELVCRLLNEDEKRKSAPRIDKNVKEGIINRLEELRCEVHSVEMKEGFSEERICSTEFANAIKIIKTLSDGE